MWNFDENLLQQRRIKAADWPSKIGETPAIFNIDTRDLPERDD